MDLSAFLEYQWFKIIKRLYRERGSVNHFNIYLIKLMHFHEGKSIFRRHPKEGDREGINSFKGKGSAGFKQWLRIGTDGVGIPESNPGLLRIRE